MTVVFDFARFYHNLNRVRIQRKLAWNKVATRVGISPSGLFTFVKQYEKPGSPRKILSVDSLTKLMHWMGKTDLTTYIVDEDSIDEASITDEP